MPVTPGPICLVGPVYPYRGGIAHFTTQLGVELRAAGLDVRVVSFARQYPAWLYPGKSDKDPSREHPALEAEYLLDPLYPWTWRRAVMCIAADRPMLVVIQWWTTFWGPAFYCLARGLRARGVPVVFMPHNILPHEARFFDRWVVSAALSQAEACIPLSSQEEQRLRALLPSMRIFSARLPRHHLSARRLPKVEARRQLGLPEDESVLLFFGIVRPYKGLGLLLEALAELAAQGFRPRLLVVGEFWESEPDYRRKLAELGLGAQVTITNRFVANEETALYFSAADGFVAPYLGGTQSGSITVAMDYGLPILASDRIITTPVSAEYPLEVFPAGDTAALSTGLARLLRRGPQALPAVPPDSGWQDLVRLLEEAAGAFPSREEKR